MISFRRYGTGAPLLLQHGFLGGSGYWEPQFAAFGHQFDVIAPDLPGFAGSGHITAPKSLSSFAEVLVELLDRLEIECSDILGHSMGSMIALQLALDYPERVKRLVLYGCAPSGDLPDRFESVTSTIARIRTEGIERTADRVVQTWFVAGGNAPFADLCRDASRGATVESAVNALQAVANWDVVERLHEIAKPVLLICGDRDRSTAPEQSLRLWRGLPNAQLCIVPGCAHNVHLERSHLFSSVVLDFLNRPQQLPTDA